MQQAFAVQCVCIEPPKANNGCTVQGLLSVSLSFCYSCATCFIYIITPLYHIYNIFIIIICKNQGRRSILQWPINDNSNSSSSFNIEKVLPDLIIYSWNKSVIIILQIRDLLNNTFF